MELRQETICEDTMEIIREYYNLNVEPLLSVLSDDCVWIGTGNLFASGAVAIRKVFERGWVMPACRMENPDFRLVETGDGGQIIVFGQYDLYTSRDAEVISGVRQRSTFCYHQGKNGWRLYHMHVSNEWGELVENEVFPVRISTQTYRYAKKLMKENAHPRVNIGIGGADQFINTDELIYIQAADKNCILQMRHKIIQVSRMMKDIQRLLPSNFCRIHRGYCVNAEYVTDIKRYVVTLATGEQLPIPKGRYMQIREELAALIEKKI